MKANPRATRWQQLSVSTSIGWAGNCLARKEVLSLGTMLILSQPEHSSVFQDHDEHCPVDSRERTGQCNCVAVTLSHISAFIQICVEDYRKHSPT